MNKISRWLTALALLAGPVIANAAITYSYGQDYLYDSTTGLYWQTAPIPTSTFIPSSAAQIATYAQLNQLYSEVGLPGLLSNTTVVPGAYSINIANLISFFSNDTPAQSQQPNPSIPAETYSLPPTFGVIYNLLGPGHGINPFDYAFSSYSRGPLLSDLNWVYQGNTTVGSYGPTNINWVCEPPNIEGPCPSAALAFLVSTVAPVPLPASTWLVLSALCGLGFMARRREDATASSS